MKILLPAVAITAALALTGMARAEDTTGTIASVSQASQTLVLTKGDTFYVPFKVDVKSFKAGDQVIVHWDPSGTRKIVAAVAPVAESN